MSFLNYLNIIAVNTTIIVYFLFGFLIYKLITLCIRLYKTFKLRRKVKKVYDGPTVSRDN